MKVTRHALHSKQTKNRCARRKVFVVNNHVIKKRTWWQAFLENKQHNDQPRGSDLSRKHCVVHGRMCHNNRFPSLLFRRLFHPSIRKATFGKVFLNQLIASQWQLYYNVYGKLARELFSCRQLQFSRRRVEIIAIGDVFINVPDQTLAANSEEYHVTQEEHVYTDAHNWSLPCDNPDSVNGHRALLFTQDSAEKGSIPQRNTVDGASRADEMTAIRQEVAPASRRDSDIFRGLHPSAVSGNLTTALDGALQLSNDFMVNLSGKETGYSNPRRLSVRSETKVRAVWFHPSSVKRVCAIGKDNFLQHVLSVNHLQMLKHYPDFQLVSGQVICYYFLALARHRNVLVLDIELIKYIISGHRVGQCLKGFYWWHDETSESEIKEVNLEMISSINVLSWDLIIGALHIKNESKGGHWNLFAVYPKIGRVCSLEPYGTTWEDSAFAAKCWKDFLAAHRNPAAGNDWRGMVIFHDEQRVTDLKNCGPIVMLLGAVLIGSLPDIPTRIPVPCCDQHFNHLRFFHAVVAVEFSDLVYDDSTPCGHPTENLNAFGGGEAIVCESGDKADFNSLQGKSDDCMRKVFNDNFERVRESGNNSDADRIGSHNQDDKAVLLLVVYKGGGVLGCKKKTQTPSTRKHKKASLEKISEKHCFRLNWRSLVRIVRKKGI